MLAFYKIIISSFVLFFLSIFSCCIPCTQAKAPHGIILISLDTLRADHLGCYGYYPNTSPSIDTFAAENILFENAVVQAPNTLPSHMSIMTSLYPSFHKVTNSSFPLDEDLLTLAELLKAGGYQTVAFTDGGYVSGSFGFNQGFDIYDDHGGGIENILPKAIQWLDTNRSEPFFLFLHCYDIHSPYNPPPPYNSMFHDFSYPSGLVPSNRNLSSAYMRKLWLTDEDVQHFIAFYDGGIRYTDENIGRFLSYLKNSGLYDDSLIIITSDHGEEFNEHGSFLHWQIYFRPNLHVPLIIHIPSFKKTPVKITNLVRSIDLLPTILDSAELPAHQGAQGKSLLPLVRQRKGFINIFVRAITALFKKGPKVSFAEQQPSRHLHYRSIITDDGYQLIGAPYSQQIKLFNLKKDPLARNNIYKDNKDKAEKLLSQLNETYSRQQDQETARPSLDDRIREQLQVLGYIEQAGEPTGDETDAGNQTILDGEQNRPVVPDVYHKDTDGDGVKDLADNCPDVANCTQADADEDSIGDICDTCSDSDWDGYGNPDFFNTCEDDNCPHTFNPTQKDTDRDGLGDLCDRDDDNDGCADSDDPFPHTVSLDRDNDGVVLDCDNCPGIPNRDQRDNDADDMGDPCDPDDDNDSIVDGDDNCPFVSNPDQTDSYPPRGNTIGDACDCEADFNCDGSVDDMDAKIFKKSKFKNMLLTNPCSNEDPCSGDFDCNGKIDEEDEILFTSDLGRSQHNNPCPACVVGEWCVYE